MTRKRVNLNRQWKFLRDDLPDARDPGFDDSSWQPIGLPHTFDLPYFRTPEFYVGVGWYRKRFTLPARARETRWSLEFEGVFQVANIFINNIPVGSHRGGYTGFAIEITDALIPGENTIAIRVSNEWNPQLAPRAGEHIFSGGIYRDVCLLATDPLCVTWNGISITTERLSPESARLKIVTEIANHSRDRRDLTLRTTVFDPDGDVVGGAISTQRADAGGVYEIAQVLDPIGNPKRWHPDHPHLYRTRTQLYNGTFLCDEIETPFGIRSIEWTAHRGFFLNGEHLYLRGANVHQDHAGWGIGITRAACERDVRLIKEAGFNFIRGAHYPHHPSFVDACDRLGVLFWSESAFWGKGGFGPEGYWNASAYPVDPADFEPFEQSCRDQLREMIEQNRNHPSIIAWSMCNEPFFTYNLDRARALLSDLVRLSRELDPTRPAAIGGAQRGEIDHLGDIAGYNGDGARLFIDPGIPNMVSEYGAISKPHDAYDPFFGELQTDRFPWRSGEAIWCGFDYGSIAGRQGLKGILNHQRLPKQSWHWYRHHILSITPPPAPRPGIPAMLRLEADKTTILGTDATDDAQIIVTVCDAQGVHISTCPQEGVTLAMESGPGEFPTGRSITFSPDSDITITDGKAAIAFRSYHGGETTIRATSPGLKDATITIHTLGEPLFIPGQAPTCPDRPYAPPAPSAAAQKALANSVNVALNRPSRASSESEHHPARFANDGNPTHWQAAPGSADTWWQVDLEGFYQISASRLTFPIEGNWRYLIELSDDAKRWRCAVDRRDSERATAIRNDLYPPGSAARYLRITITGVPGDAEAPALSEVEVFGILSVQ